MVKHDAVILGAGIAGLSCGVRLAEADLSAWPAIDFIRRHGGEVRLGSPVDGLVRRDGRVRSVHLGNGCEVDGEAVVLAVQPTAVAPLLPAGHPLAQTAGLFLPSPYISCYLSSTGPSPRPGSGRGRGARRVSTPISTTCIGSWRCHRQGPTAWVAGCGQAGAARISERP